MSPHRIGARRLASTFSIVAFDPQADELGVAVASHYFSVASGVPWAERGVGAIALEPGATSSSSRAGRCTCARDGPRRRGAMCDVRSR